MHPPEERPDDYEAVNDYVEALLGGRKPRAAKRLRGKDAELLRMAAWLNSVSASDRAPRRAFLESLRARLEDDGRRGFWSWQTGRRGLLGGLAGAALLLAGAFGDQLFARLRTLPRPAGGWVPVARAAELPPGRVMRFIAGDVEGHLLNIGGRVWALSAICTHQACVLNWQASANVFVCPCHGAEFDADGAQHPVAAYQRQLPPLAHFPVQQVAGQIYVLPTAGEQTDDYGGPPH